MPALFGDLKVLDIKYFKNLQGDLKFKEQDHKFYFDVAFLFRSLYSEFNTFSLADF